jgi:hypothetical protein
MSTTQYIFNLCVDLLYWGAGLLGTDYVTINVWIFCVIWPIITLLLVAFVVMEFGYIFKLKRRLKISGNVQGKVL